MSYHPRRPRHNAGFQRKRPKVIAERPTSREMQEKRLLNFIKSDPRRMQQNDPVSPRDVAMAKVGRSGCCEENIRSPSHRRCGEAPNRPPRRGAIKLCHVAELPPLTARGPPYPGQARLGSAGFCAAPAADRKITAQDWALVGASGTAAPGPAEVPWAPNPMMRPKMNQLCLPPLAGHFPGVQDLMTTQTWRIPTETPLGSSQRHGRPDISLLSSPFNPLCPERSAIQAHEENAKPEAAGPTAPGPAILVRAQRPVAEPTAEEHACREPAHDWFDLCVRESLASWSYHRRAFSPRLLRMQAALTKERLAEIEKNKRAFRNAPPWWAQLFKIETADSAYYSWLYWVDSANELASTLSKQKPTKIHKPRGLARLYLDWVFCRQALPTVSKTPELPPRSGSGSGTRKPHYRRPRSNPLRDRRRQSFCRSPVCLEKWDSEEGDFKVEPPCRSPDLPIRVPRAPQPFSAPAGLFCEPGEMGPRPPMDSPMEEDEEENKENAEALPSPAHNSLGDGNGDAVASEADAETESVAQQSGSKPGSASRSAIVIRRDSPGGDGGASEALHTRLESGC